MIHLKIKNSTNVQRNISTIGERLETKLDRIVNNKEPIKDGTPLIYTERKEGVRASTNIKTDRWEIAVDATDKIAKSYAARRENKGLTVDKPDDGIAEPTHGKAEPTT